MCYYSGAIHVLLRNPVMHCAFTRDYRTRHRLFPGSPLSPPPLSIVLPSPTNSYNYVHVPIHNPPPSTLNHPSVERSVARVRVSQCFDTAVLSLSFLSFLSRLKRDDRGEGREEAWGPSFSIYLSVELYKLFEEN